MSASSPDDGASLLEEWKYGPGKNISIIRSSSAIVSIVASALLVWILFRSRHGINITYHRLLLGLSISDIFLSLSLATFSAVVPSELNYAVWNARGSRASCDAFGFMQTLGAFSGLLYMCALNLYYLAKVRFNKSDTYIAKKLEPWLHLVPTLFGLIVSVAAVAKQGMNASINGLCNIANGYEPPHCDGYEDGDIPEGFEIPCGRGRTVQPIIIVTGFLTAFIVPITIGGSLLTIYRTVSRAERRIARYGAGALQTSRAQPTTTDDATTTDVEGGGRGSLGAFSMRSVIRRRSSSGSASSTNSTNRDSSQSRAVLQRAAAYSVGYFVTWIWSIVVGFLIVAGTWTTDLPQPKWQIAYAYTLYFFNSLQGLWTFLIYMQPSVIKRRRSSGGNTSYFRAFADALWSAVTGRTSSTGSGRRQARPRTFVPRTTQPLGATGTNPNPVPAPAPAPEGGNTSATAGSTDRQGNLAGAEVVGLEAEDAEESGRSESSNPLTRRT